uniref:Uncharacterized protein n=1 Tax=Cacopsylla melanoneura TaxID=428564 RepID=A0A8D8TL62_9HEMI
MLGGIRATAAGRRTVVGRLLTIFRRVTISGRRWRGAIFGVHSRWTAMWWWAISWRGGWGTKFRVHSRGKRRRTILGVQSREAAIFEVKIESTSSSRSIF